MNDLLNYKKKKKMFCLCNNYVCQVQSMHLKITLECLIFNYFCIYGRIKSADIHNINPFASKHAIIRNMHIHIQVLYFFIRSELPSNISTMVGFALTLRLREHRQFSGSAKKTLHGQSLESVFGPGTLTSTSK